MTSTLTPTCSICGLRFENRPILELHIREDHPQHSASAEPGNGSKHQKPTVASRAETETGGAGPRRSHLGWARAGLRRVIGAVRHANAQFLLASETMLPPGGGPRPRQPADPPAEPDAQQAATSGRASR